MSVNTASAFTSSFLEEQEEKQEKTNRMALLALKRQHYFFGLADEDLMNIISICRAKELAQGDVLFREGDSSYGMFMLLSGKIAVSTAKAGTVSELHAGQIFGEMGAIAAIKRTATATVMEDSVVLHINHIQFMAIMEKYPKAGQKVMTNICKVLVKRVTELSSQV